jgi:Holliday junction resolvase RusA-like endonuclease
MEDIAKKRINFRIIGYPVGWTAPKQGIVKGSSKRIFYQTPQLKRWQETVRAQVTYNKPLIVDGALAIVLHFFLEKPKSNRQLFPTTKPDLDNLIKSTIDAMKKLVMKDDNIIQEIKASKRWCSDRYQPKGGIPGVDVSIYRVEE